MVLKAKFENENETTAAETATVPVTDAAAAATTAVATASATSAVAVRGEVQPALSELKDVIHVEWDTLTRIVADGSNLTVNDEIVGAWLEMKVVSWQDSWSIEPGDQSDDAKQYLRFSEDGQTLRDSGQPVGEYLKYLKDTLGYEKASLKHRVILVGLVQKSEKPSGIEGELAQISLAPQSKKSWDRYQLNASIKAKLGQLVEGSDPSMIRLTAVRTSSGPYKYTTVEVSAAK